MEVKPTKDNQIISGATADFAPSRFEDGQAMVLAGVRQHYTYGTMRLIPAQWHQFGPRIDAISQRTGTADYGVVINTPDLPDFDYLTGFEVNTTSGLPADFTTLEIPAQRYAVFVHSGNVSTLCETIDGAFQKWLPRSGFRHAGMPDMFERYGPGFNPTTGSGDLEIWVPVKNETE